MAAKKKQPKRAAKRSPKVPAAKFTMATPEMLRELLGKPSTDQGQQVVLPAGAFMYLLERACNPLREVQAQPDIRSDIGALLDRLRGPALDPGASLHNEAALAYHALVTLMTAMNVADNPQSHELTRAYFAAISSTDQTITSIKDKVAAHAKECATCQELARAMHVIPPDQSAAN